MEVRDQGVSEGNINHFPDLSETLRFGIYTLLTYAKLHAKFGRGTRKFYLAKK